jgi:hypothetical protein
LTNIANIQQGANNNAVAHAYDQANATTNFLFSSKKLKHHKRPVSGKKVTEGLQRTPIGSWQYNKGVADGGEHMGPMAEDMHKQFGDKVAPGGKMLDAISLHGIALKVAQNNANRLDKIERKMGLTRKG